MRRYFSTIKGKIVGSVVLIQTLLMLFFVTYNTVRSYNMMLDHTNKMVHQVGAIVATNSSYWLFNKDLSGLDEIIKNTKNVEDFHSAYIMEISGNIVASSDRSYLNHTLTDRYSLELLEMVRENPESCIEIIHHGLIDTIHPIFMHGEVIGYSRVLFNYERIEQSLKDLVINAVIYSLIAVALGAFIAWFLMEAISKRVKALTRSANAISQGELNAAIPVATGSDEVDLLSNALRKMQGEINRKIQELSVVNEILENRVESEVGKRREQEQILIQQSKLASMGEMINAIAHQWRQPLNGLVLLVQDLEDAFNHNELDKEYLHESVEKALQIAGFMSGTIDDFRNFFKPTKEAREFELGQSIDDVIKLISSQLKNNNITVVVNKPKEAVTVWGYPNEFKQVIVNIMNNARQAILQAKNSGTITVTIAVEPNSKKVIICDDGVGIDQNKAQKIFDPYFTTKLDSGGTGIGLYMSKIIIEKNMGGKLSLAPSEVGACFEVELPNR